MSHSQLRNKIDDAHLFYVAMWRTLLAVKGESVKCFKCLTASLLGNSCGNC